MKAIVYHQYGSPDVLQLEDIQRPKPASAEVLIQVRAASVNPADWHFMRGLPYLLRLASGIRTPKITRFGIDVAGEIEEVGSGVTQFKPGDEVFGGCRGSLAEYVCARESDLAVKPANITFEEAASVAVAALTALQALRAGSIRPGHKVLVNGAAGGVGTFAVQIAKSFDADVTAVCSTSNADMVRSIGADHVIDYTREDVTRGSQTYDLILDCVGNHSLTAFRKLLNRDGKYVAVGGPSGRWMIGGLVRVFGAALLSQLTRRKVVTMLGKLKKEDLVLVGELMGSGKVKPVIGRRYNLSEVREAIRYIEEGHARGKVIVTVAPNVRT